MKKIIFLFSLIITTFFSCEDNRLEGMYDDSVLFVKNGKIQATGFLSNEKIEIDIPIYRSGISTDLVNISVDIDPMVLNGYQNSDGESFSLLPTDNYSLTGNLLSFADDKRMSTLKLSIDIKKLSSIQGLLDEKFAIPLVLKSNGIKIDEEKGKMIIIPVLTGGIKPGSEERLWSKTFTELGINPTDHFTASLAVTSKYVYVNTRNADLRYYDRFTGEYVGSIQLPFKGSLTNFTVTNDEHDNLLITNLRNATGQALQTIYKISDGGAPSVFINVTHEYPNGRKMSVLGDLNGKALITSTVENSSNVLVWKVENGQVVTQMPEVITLDQSKILWRNFGDAIPLSFDLNDGLFAVGNGTVSAFGYFGRNGQLIGALDLNQFGMPIENSLVAQSLAMVKFNGARYLALAIQSGPNLMYSSIVDVTKTKNIGVVPTNSLIVYTSSPIQTTTNTNVTADIQVRLDDDQKSFVVYSLGTNGSVTATKFTD